ncbi:MAG: phosphatase PAP2 family protein, partial [Alphaproteobacteria bacterium]|nr:phosphatase PAP2 family protein [Alphaproteobacteria bacterium]
WKVLLAVLLPLLVAISRNYLGVHYPTDVLMGLGIGYIFSIGCLLFGNKIEALFKKLHKMFILSAYNRYLRLFSIRSS